MCTKLKNLEVNLQNQIVQPLKQYFDQIKFENRIDWIMIIHYGPYEFIESFNHLQLELYENFHALEIEEMFEKQKLRLFLNGVYLYYRKSIKNIKLACDAYDEHYAMLSETKVF